MKDKLLDYIAAAENATNPIPGSSCRESIHLHEIKDFYGDTTTSDSQCTQLENIKSAATEELKQFRALCSFQDVKEDVDVLALYESVKYKVPKIRRMATYIVSIPPTQIQNERESSQAGVIGQRASVSIEKLSDLLFINKIMDGFLHEKSSEFFDGNVNSLTDDLVDEVEQLLDSSNETEG
jgi:hypothetical protein